MWIGWVVGFNIEEIPWKLMPLRIYILMSGESTDPSSRTMGPSFSNQFPFKRLFCVKHVLGVIYHNVYLRFYICK